MDKSAIRNYAVAARRKLMEAVRQKAFELYIFEDGALPAEEAYQRLRADGIYLSSVQSEARQLLVSELADLGDTLDNETAYSHIIEEVAYTWFNRLIALRFMEVNDYLPSGIRILSSLDKGRVEPDAMREAERLDYVDQKKIADLRVDTSAGAAAKLYRYIIIAQCNALSEILPCMFERLGDYTELLLPDSLYAKGGIVHDLVNAIAEEDFRDQVQIIGWLYQYYISEKKDEVFTNLKKNIKINKETIPAATQLFTPEWIVKYMVENSLGRLWLERDRAESGLSSEYMNASYYGWKYYVEEAEQEPEVAEQLRVLRAQSPIKRPEDIKLIDPCMGSGHILAYAFDVLYQIYQSQGYAERDIPNLILTHNLYGLDIDDRAGQLAYFALMMKARSYNRRFFRQDSIPQPMVHAIPETVAGCLAGADAVFGAHMKETDKKSCFENVSYLAKLFENGKEYGSIMKIEREIDYPPLRAYIHDHAQEQMTWGVSEILDQVHLLDKVIDVAAALSRKYDVVVTNPPYMGSGGMSTALNEYVKNNYTHSKNDMSTVFMDQTLNLCTSNGYMAMINIPVWMFLSTYEKLREKLLQNKSLVNMLHLGRGIFGSDFGTTAFVFSNYRINEYRAKYRMLFPKQGAVDSVEQKEIWFFENIGEYVIKQEDYKRIPGLQIAYWISGNFLHNFERGRSLSDFGNLCLGMRTGNNDRFLRLWFEVDFSTCNFNAQSGKDAYQSKKKWFPYNKGGDFRKWFGNGEYVVNWENDGYEIKENTKLVYPQLGDNLGWKISNENMYFCEGIAWSRISSSKFGVRYCPRSMIFDTAAPMMFPNEPSMMRYLLAMMCSCVAFEYLRMINPTIAFQVGDVSVLPLVVIDDMQNIDQLVERCIDISRSEWDSFETSWDFQTHPLIQFKMAGAFAWSDSSPRCRISSAYKAWDMFAEGQFTKLKSNEEELNRFFIDIYGLQDELTPEVEDKDVTIRKADLGRDIRSFLSYAVGCMFGRYSLDEPGLIYAGGQFHMSRYKTYLPEEDNIAPIGSADYFDDDIVVRFTDFVRQVYGEDTLGENLNFIADALYPGGSGSARERIRRYFLNDFYKDHVKIYQKRPIYWLLDSGKNDGFKALVYLQRYDKFTVARVRTDYLHPLQRKYEAEVKRLDMLSTSTENAREKAAYRKEIDTLRIKMEECRIYDQVVSHIAHQQIELDLDDGVKVNYAKFQDVAVPKDNGRSEKMDLLAKI